MQKNNIFVRHNSHKDTWEVCEKSGDKVVVLFSGLIHEAIAIRFYNLLTR